MTGMRACTNAQRTFSSPCGGLQAAEELVGEGLDLGPLVDARGQQLGVEGGGGARLLRERKDELRQRLIVVAHLGVVVLVCGVWFVCIGRSSIASVSRVSRSVGSVDRSIDRSRR
jgi:hypothetical protein